MIHRMRTIQCGLLCLFELNSDIIWHVWFSSWSRYILGSGVELNYYRDNTNNNNSDQVKPKGIVEKKRK